MEFSHIVVLLKSYHLDQRLKTKEVAAQLSGNIPLCLALVAIQDIHTW